MTMHQLASREAWLDARRDLLAAEKDLTRRSDLVAQLRRQLPWVRIDKQYVFEREKGKCNLADLFAGRRQLIVQHFMLTPGAAQGCASCSFMADHADAMMPHLAARDTAFAAVSRAPFDEIARFRSRMGWQFPWVSAFGSDFNYDFRVSFTKDELARGTLPYNYGDWPHAFEEWPGISVFWRDDSGAVFHTYSTYGRGVEVMMGTYRLLDLTPMGRNERDVPHKMEWVRHHDRYGEELNAGPCCGHGETR
jgi:predicted dithiol-disulfide oxidoreductase (DUF899 family)